MLRQLVTLLLVAFATSASSDVHIFSEDFFDAEFKDVTATTAGWDTALGRIELPLFEIGMAGNTGLAGFGLRVEVVGDIAYAAVMYAVTYSRRS